MTSRFDPLEGLAWADDDFFDPEDPDWRDHVPPASGTRSDQEAHGGTPLAVLNATGSGAAAGRGGRVGGGGGAFAVADFIGRHAVWFAVGLVVSLAVGGANVGTYALGLGYVVAYAAGLHRGFRGSVRARLDQRRSGGFAGRTVSVDPARVGSRRRKLGPVR